MNFSSLFIIRPVMTTLVSLAIIFFGLFGFKYLPVNALPNIDFPTIQVSASLVGADPETMASAVALPLEKQFSTIAGVDSITSTSSQGNTSITIQFNLDKDLNAAALDVQSAISTATRQLPDNMTSQPTFRKVNPADMPIFYLALTSDTLPITKVDEYAQTVISQQIAAINGVAQVQIYGSQKYAVRIQFNPEQLKSTGLSILDVETAINNNNVNLPTGNLKNDENSLNIKVDGQLKNAEQYKSLILKYQKGSPIYLNSIATITDDVENNEVMALYNNKRGMVLAVQRQPNTNTIEIIENIKRLLPDIIKKSPSGINFEILFDRSVPIKHSVFDVEFTLILSLILVVIVVFVFLRNVTSTLIICVSLPVSLIGTFFIMYYLNYSINVISLMALTLSVGFVVDDAIVVLENIIRHKEMGKSNFKACIDGTKEISFTIISMTLSLAIVFVPILMMQGIIGKLLHEFAATIIVTIILSGFISISAIPMLCNNFLKDEIHGSIKFLEFFDKFFYWLKDQYAKTLTVTIKHKNIALTCFILITVLTFFLYKTTKTGFMPDEDTGQIIVTTEAREDVSFIKMNELHKKLSTIFLEYPHIQSVMSSVSSSGSGRTLNNGIFFLRLKDRSNRPAVGQIIRELNTKLAKTDDIKVYLQNLPTIRIGAISSKSQYQYSFQGIDQAELYSFIPEVLNTLRNTSGFLNVTSDLQISNPQYLIDIDRNKLAQLDIDVKDVENTLYNYYGSKQISNFYTSIDQYNVILEVLPEFRKDSGAFEDLYIKSGNGELIPIESVAKIVSYNGPLSVSHYGQLPVVTVSFDLDKGVALGDGMKLFEKVLASMKIPDSISGGFQGTAKTFQSTFSNLIILIIVCIISIYIILGILYESFIHPVTILSGLPTAAFGALLTLILFNKELDLYGFVGLIMLTGIIKKNAIMIIDFAIEYKQKHHKPVEEIIVEACIVRFRPILMTTLAAFFGALPIALGVGSTGGERVSLGLTVVGGLVTSQILTLYITPVLYIIFDKYNKFEKKEYIEEKAL